LLRDVGVHMAQLRTSGSASHFVGFDGLRLLAALSVIFSHAFLLATGSETSEPLVRILGPGNIIGLYGVFTFFIISGFLLARSLSANARPLNYAVNRALRIFPGFAFCIALTALVFGPLFSSSPSAEYFSHSNVVGFFRISLGTLTDQPLRGVFSYDGELATVVNGSLWSLHYEALSYVFLLVLWIVLRSQSTAAAAAVLLSTLVWFSPVFAQRLLSIGFTLPYFAAGVAMSWVHDKYGTRHLGAVISASCFVASAALGLQFYAFAVFGAYLIVYFGERRNPGSAIASTIGDCSYGLYLYGWPAEQMVKQLTGTASAGVLFLLATPLAFALALISYHAVERPAMGARGAVLAAISRPFETWSADRAWYASWGARAGFVLMATFILTSRGRWWYLLWSVGLIILSAAAGSILAMAGGAVASAWRRGGSIRSGQEGGLDLLALHESAVDRDRA